MPVCSTVGVIGPWVAWFSFMMGEGFICFNRMLGMGVPLMPMHLLLLGFPVSSYHQTLPLRAVEKPHKSLHALCSGLP